jgi:hydrogenase nickel incorporation protein HypA/HybF
MHETAVAQSLIETIVQECREHKGKPIAAKISCGSLNAINDDSLLFAFEIMAEGTPCQGMALQIEHKPVEARCRGCNGTYAVTPENVRCPQCGREDFELLPDAPLLLEEITFEED